MALQADGLPVKSPSSPAWMRRSSCLSPVPACLVTERGLSTVSTKRADGHMWNAQSALFAELAKIEVQQRTVIQQINSLKSERCEKLFCGYQTSAQLDFFVNTVIVFTTSVRNNTRRNVFNASQQTSSMHAHVTTTDLASPDMDVMSGMLALASTLLHAGSWPRRARSRWSRRSCGR